MAKEFLDSNVLVYALDKHDADKQRTARHLLARTQRDGAGVISTQILQEFYVAATKKLGADASLQRLVEEALSR